jgi:hypothetical protein
MVGANGFKKTTSGSTFANKDLLTMNNDGSKIYFLLTRSSCKCATLTGYGFIGTAWSDVSTPYSWYLDDPNQETAK